MIVITPNNTTQAHPVRGLDLITIKPNNMKAATPATAIIRFVSSKRVIERSFCAPDFDITKV